MRTKKVEARIIRVMAWVIYPYLRDNVEPSIKDALFSEMLKIERILYESSYDLKPQVTLLMMADKQPYRSCSTDNKKRPIYKKAENRLLDFFATTADRWLLIHVPTQTRAKIKIPLSKIKIILSGSMGGAML